MIRDKLVELGLNLECIKDCAGTGLIADIKGCGPEVDGGDVKSVALRADMDALPMKENNPHLPYKSKTKFAHMCGHDGHMATLVTTAQVLINNK